MYPLLLFLISQLSHPSGSRRRERGIEKNLWSVFGLIPEGNKEIITEKNESRIRKYHTDWRKRSQKTVQIQKPQEFCGGLRKGIGFPTVLSRVKSHLDFKKEVDLS